MVLNLLPALLLALTATFGDDDPEGPKDGVFYLRDVSIWQADGSLLENRSMLLRDGLIVAIGGPELAAPPEARILRPDDEWIVYPGLVHANLGQGVPEPPLNPYPEEATDASKDPIVEMEWSSRKDLRGWMHVSDTMEWEADEHDSWRDAGFTSAYVLPNQGLVRGRAAWISLNERPLGQSLLARDGLLTLSIYARRGGYPGTAMAALAVLRQAFLDGRRLLELAESGTARRHVNPDLETLARDDGRPLLFLANRAREIENILDLLRDFAPGRKLVILGGRDAWKHAERLKAVDAAVLFTLDLADVPKSDEDLKIKEGEERPYWQTPAALRAHDREQHQRQVEAFVKLHAAGVRCGLVPGGKAKELGDDVEQLLEAGLELNQIVAAMSGGVARILGLQGAGAVAASGPADFVVSRGAWNFEKPHLAWVFADGRGYSYPKREEKQTDEDAEGEEGAKEDASDAPDLAEQSAKAINGEWVFTAEIPGAGEQIFHVEFDVEAGTAMLWQADEPDDKLEVDNVDFGEFKFSLSFSPPGMDMSMSFRGEVFGTDAEAELVLPDPMGTIEAMGTKVPDKDWFGLAVDETLETTVAEERNAEEQAQLYVFELPSHWGAFHLEYSPVDESFSLWAGDRSVRIENTSRHDSGWVFDFAQPGCDHTGCLTSGKPEPGHFELPFLAEARNFALQLEAHLEGEESYALLRSPAGEMRLEGHRVVERASSDEEDEGWSARSGHPEYPIETRDDRMPDVELEGDVLITDAMLYPMTGDAPFEADLFIKDGMIVDIGQDLVTTATVPVLDGNGWHIMPGVIDAHSHLALDAVNEGSVSITAECRIGDMIRPEDVGIYRAAAGGTAIAQSLHGSANPIGGQAAVWELDYRRTQIGDLLFPGAKQGIKFALGENVKRSNGGGNSSRFPAARTGVEAVYRRAFTAAKHYIAARKRAAEGKEPNFRRDVRLEVLADILENEIHIQIHSYRADEILMFVRLCQELGIERPTFQHVLEGYKVAPEMASIGAMGSSFSDWWAYKIEAYDAIPWNPYLLDKAGVVATINSDSNEMIRRLNTEAGKSLLYGGMDYEGAMALCTLNAAKQLRIDDRVGSLEIGKHGTISVYDAPPLSNYAKCLMTLARGRTLFYRNEQHETRWTEYIDAVRHFVANANQRGLVEETEESEVEEEQPGAGADREAAAPQDESVTLTAGVAATNTTRTAAEWKRWTHAGHGRAVFIRNLKLNPISSEAFEGSMLIEDGRIAWLGQIWDGMLPPGCEVIDAKGLEAYPGFINCGDAVGLYEIGSVRGTVDMYEIGGYQPDLSIASAIHADSAHVRVHRMSGITTMLTHGGSGRIAGQPALIHLGGDTSEELVAVPDVMMHINFPRVSAGKDNKAPDTPDGLDDLNEWFDKALEYAERLERFPESGYPLPERDLKLEALLPYARGEKPLLIEVGGSLGVIAALKWVRDRELDAVYMVGNEAYKVAGILGAEAARVITGSVHSLPRRRTDPYDAPFRLPSVLAAAGCQVGLSTQNIEVARNLPYQAATAAAHGWGRDAALRALTLGAAEVLGVSDMTGSLEVGKVADFFLTDGDPLDFESEVKRMWIGGHEVELTSKQTELRDRYEARIDRVHAEAH